MYKKRRYCSLKCAAVSTGIDKKKFTENYSTLHWRVREARGPASGYSCEHCGSRARDWAWLHEHDGQDPADFIPLCRKCHVAYDDTPGKVAAAMRNRGSSGWTPERRAAASARMSQTMRAYYKRKREQA